MLGEQRAFRISALAWVVLALLAGCGTAHSTGGGHPSGLRAGEGIADDEQLFAVLPTDFVPVQVDEDEFSTALAYLLLDIPLKVSQAPMAVQPGRLLAHASEPPLGEAWQPKLSQEYERFCTRRGTAGDCLSLLEDGRVLQSDDKRRIALALAVGPALEGVSAEVRAMLHPTRLLAMVGTSLTVYMALLLAPEPVSKGVAAAFTVLMWGYLGWEFWDLIRAYTRLSDEAARASTFEELRAIGERFGQVIGPNSVRILVMVGLFAAGGPSALTSKLPRLPGFTQASRTAEAHSGMRLVEASTGAQRVIVSAPEGTIRVVVPPHAVTMATRGPRSASQTTSGRLVLGSHRAFKSFRDLKKALGPAGPDKNWHHIVEQHRGNLQRFGPEALHNTENVIRVESELHTRISALYSTKLPNSSKTLRQWLSEQSYEAQREYGLRTLRRFGVDI